MFYVLFCLIYSSEDVDFTDHAPISIDLVELEDDVISVSEATDCQERLATCFVVSLTIPQVF